jgi:hypothetical protein
MFLLDKLAWQLNLVVSLRHLLTPHQKLATHVRHYLQPQYSGRTTLHNGRTLPDDVAAADCVDSLPNHRISELSATGMGCSYTTFEEGGIVRRVADLGNWEWHTHARITFPWAHMAIVQNKASEGCT